MEGAPQLTDLEFTQKLAVLNHGFIQELIYQLPEQTECRAYNCLRLKLNITLLEALFNKEVANVTLRNARKENM